MRYARSIVICLFVIGSVLQVPLTASANPGLSVQSIDGETVTADSLASMLAGDGVSVVGPATYSPGAPNASGTFSGGEGIIGFGSGILLTSGNVNNVVGPNNFDSITANNGGAGDSDLTALSGFPTNDASVLEFNFTTDQDTVFFQYVFSSDEYNEYVDTPYNDTFGFFVNNTNCATVEGDPVTINTINQTTHSDLYRNNDLQDGGGSIDTEMDGLTTVLTCEANVNVGPESTNHIKLAIADATDFAYDSAVFLKAGSFSTTPSHTLSVAVSGDGSGNVDSNPPGISCPGIEGPCSNQFDEGTEVTLTATPDESSTFGGWGGDCVGQTTDTCTLTMGADKNVTASFDPAASADLSIAKSDTAAGYGPDPVSSGQIVAYEVLVTNTGPDTATGITVNDSVGGSGGTIVGASGTNWNCSIDTESNTATCTRAAGSDSLASGATAEPIRIEVQAPTTTEGTTIDDTATVSGNENDPNTENNTASDSTPVSSSGTPDFATGFCPSTGCTISTDNGAPGATPDDPTVSTLDVPAGVDPQTITMAESTSATFCGGAPCQGQILTITSSLDPMTFSGIDDPTDPVVLTMIFDKTVKQGSKVYINKGGVTTVVKNCTVTGVAAPRPCLSEKNILVGGGDRAFIILFLEGDPIIGKR